MKLKLTALLWNVLIIGITVACIQILESIYQYSHYNYDSFFSVYSDNIGQRSQFVELSATLPIDVVYTWVNGSDPDLVVGLRRTKDQLVKSGDFAYVKISGEGQIYSKITDALTNETSIKCLLRDCIESNLIVFQYAAGGKQQRADHQKLTKQHVVTAFPDASTALRFITPDQILSSNSSTNVIIAEVLHEGTRDTILKQSPLSPSIKAYQAYLTTTSNIEESLPWQESIMLSNLQSNLKEEHQITGTLPDEAKKGLVKVDVRKNEKVALVQFLEEQFTVDSLNYFYQNPAVLGQVQVNPCFLLWNIQNIQPDPEWLSASRFADNEELKYSLRSLEKFAPWVRHVFIVTNGQIPGWLNLESPRLTIITHDQIFPPGGDYLPTYSSPAIESQLHKIPGLSKNFLYFNDDVMLGQHIYPQDFYTHQTGYKIYPGWPVPPCRDQCPNAWVNDGYCDATCNYEECDFDGGDCVGDNKPDGNNKPDGDGQGGRQVNELQNWRNSMYDDDACATGCSDGWLGDHYCDFSCNKKSCGFDMGDCGVLSFKYITNFTVKAAQSQFNHSIGKKSFLIDVAAYCKQHSLNVSQVLFEKSDVIRTVRRFAPPHNLVQVVLKGHKNSRQSSNYTWNMKVHLVNSEGVQVTTLNLTTFLFTPITRKPLQYLNKSGGGVIVDIKDKEPKILEHIPPPESVLSIHFTDAMIESKLLPRNISMFAVKLKSWYEKKFVAESVYHQVMSELLSPYMPQLLQNSVETGAGRKANNTRIGLAEIFPDIGKLTLNSLDQEDKQQLHNELPSYQNRKLQSLEENHQDRGVDLENDLSEAAVSAEKKPRKKSNLTSESFKDSFRGSLRFVNKLYDREFGSSTQRMVIAHMPHFINKEIMEEVQKRFPYEFDQTARHKIRMGNDMQYAFSYFQYIQSVRKNSNYLDVFEYFDADSSGVLSDRELRVLATYLYPVPITLETMNEFENGLRACANSRAQKGIVEDPPKKPEMYFSENMPQVTVMLLFNCQEMLRKITNHFNAEPKYRHTMVADVDSQVMFKMLPNNLSSLITQLDEVRHNRKKFICLNDNFDHNQQDAPVMRAVIQDFYEGIYPIQSQFELPREYRNRFLHLGELKAWQSFRWKLKIWSHIFIGLLVVISIGSFIQEKVTAFYQKVSPSGPPSPSSLPF